MAEYSLCRHVKNCTKLHRIPRASEPVVATMNEIVMNEMNPDAGSIPYDPREMYLLAMEAHGGDVMRACWAAQALWGRTGSMPSAAHIAHEVNRVDEAVMNAGRRSDEAPISCALISRTRAAARARVWLATQLNVPFDDAAEK